MPIIIRRMTIDVQLQPEEESPSSPAMNEQGQPVPLDTVVRMCTAAVLSELRQQQER